MQLIHSGAEIRAWSRAARAQGERIGFVPTMGFLHEGHLSLVRLARQHADRVVVSIFVNPTQFAPGEDLDRYPRDEAADLAKCRAEGVDAVFLPPVEEMYPAGSQTLVSVELLSQGLCGTNRPTHFRGVATVVSLLFHMVEPDAAVFGEKDYQQLKVIQRLVRDQAFPVEIVPGPLVREPDGVAMSSRNAYLGAEERRQAAVLHRSLFWARDQVAGGRPAGPDLASEVRARIEESPLADVDYVSLVDDDELTPVGTTTHRATRLAVAVRFGKTRLLDNVRLTPAVG
jgi:pantoate--beta-alanine ligase